MDSEAVPNFGRTESIVIPFPGQPLDVSLDSPPDTATDSQRTTNGHNRTYTFKQAATLLAVNESTLRRRYWQAKIEPAFKHCPTPLREVVRYHRDNQPVHEFSEFGLSILQAFLAAKAEDQEETFLLQAREQYPAPLLPATQPNQPHEIIDGETVDETPGSLTTYIETKPATPLIQFNFQNLNVHLASADTTPLQQQTQQAQTVTAQAAGVLQQAVSAKFKADIAQVIAQNENLAAGIQATAVVGAMQDLGLGKPVAAPATSPAG